MTPLVVSVLVAFALTTVLVRLGRGPFNRLRTRTQPPPAGPESGGAFARRLGIGVAWIVVATVVFFLVHSAVVRLLPA